MWSYSVFNDFTDDDEEEDDDEDDSPWLWVDAQGSREGYRDMELFIDTVELSIVIPPPFPATTLTESAATMQFSIVGCDPRI